MDCGFEIAGASNNTAWFESIGREPERPSRARAVQAVRLEKITHYIESNLDDPELAAPRCAKELGMSVRSLHMAFSGTDLTFGELVMQRRLEMCRHQLADWNRTESVAELAFAAGFNSLSSFYRAFRRTFATCPRAMREGDMLAAQ